MTKRILATACLGLALPLQAQDFATSFDATEVVPGIHMLTGADGKFGGGNISVLLGDEQVVLIDDAMVPTAQPVLDAVKKLLAERLEFGSGKLYVEMLWSGLVCGDKRKIDVGFRQRAQFLLRLFASFL